MRTDRPPSTSMVSPATSRDNATSLDTIRASCASNGLSSAGAAPVMPATNKADTSSHRVAFRSERVGGYITSFPRRGAEKVLVQDPGGHDRERPEDRGGDAHVAQGAGFDQVLGPLQDPERDPGLHERARCLARQGKHGVPGPVPHE